MNYDETLFWALLLVTATAALTDAAQHRTPTWLAAATALLGLGYYGLTRGWAGMWFASEGMAAGLALLTVAWVIGVAKPGHLQLAAVGALLGPHLTWEVLLLSVSVAAGGAIALIVPPLRMRLLRRRWTRSLIRMPFAVPLAGCCWLVLLYG